MRYCARLRSIRVIGHRGLEVKQPGFVHLYISTVPSDHSFDMHTPTNISLQVRIIQCLVFIVSLQVRINVILVKDNQSLTQNQLSTGIEPALPRYHQGAYPSRGQTLPFGHESLQFRFPFPANHVSNFTLQRIMPTFYESSARNEVTSLSQVTGLEVRHLASYFYFLYLTITLFAYAPKRLQCID